MGRKARYCAFHSMEGSGAQHRNSIICGVTLEDCLRDEDLCEKVNLLCPSFLQYGVSTPSQTKELKEIQERATKLGRRHDYTIRKLYHIHEQSEWNWKAANNKIRDSLKVLEGNHSEDSEMKDLLNSIVHTTTVPDAVLEFWKTLIPTPATTTSQCPATVAANSLLKNTNASTSTTQAMTFTGGSESTQHQTHAAHNSDLVNSLTLPSSVSRTNSIARVPSFGLSRPLVSRTNSASAVFDFCKSSDSINLFAPTTGSSNILSNALGRTQ